MNPSYQSSAVARLVRVAFIAGLLLVGSRISRADYRDGPKIANDTAADIGDVYFFLDPNDNSRAILSMTVGGFIVPSEAPNQAIFDPTVTYQFRLEGTGDAATDMFVNVTFSPRTSTGQAQTATVRAVANGKQILAFNAPATNPSVSSDPPDPVITTRPNSGIKFFAGEVDDPFFFDLTAFTQYVASFAAGSPTTSPFLRGRDSFAGYNTMAIVLSIPTTLLPHTNNKAGASAATFRDGKRIDRMGLPLVSFAAVPFSRRDEFNASVPLRDAAGQFNADMVATLKGLGVNDPYINILLNIWVTHGDILRLDLGIPNAGTNPEASFPNGRRPLDDVIDTILTLLNNGTYLSDNVNGNDVGFRATFPFFAAPQQPRYDTAVDDHTRN